MAEEIVRKNYILIETSSYREEAKVVDSYVRKGLKSTIERNLLSTYKRHVKTTTLGTEKMVSETHFFAVPFRPTQK